MARNPNSPRFDGENGSPDNASPFELAWLKAYIGPAKGNASEAARQAGSVATGRALRVEAHRLKARMRNPVRGILALHGQDMYSLIGKQVDALNAVRVTRMLVNEKVQTFSDVDYKTRMEAARYLLILSGAEAIAKRLAAEETGLLTDLVTDPINMALSFEPDAFEDADGSLDEEEVVITQDGLTYSQAEQMVAEGNRRLKTIGYQIVPFTAGSQE